MKKVRKIVVLLFILAVFFTIVPVTSANAAAEKHYIISGKNIELTVTEGTDISKDVNAALKEANARAMLSNEIYTVKLPEGTYYISESLKIKSNTVLDATGCTINSQNGTFNMIATGSAEENLEATGYNGYQNITIKGGTWINSKSNKASGIRLCRGNHITLENIDMSHGSEKHMVEMAAVQDVTITGCTFHDSDVKDAREKCEAIQIDISANRGAFSSIKYDGTPCKDITITGNTFENVSRGIGTHSMLLNSYIDNVKILNNTFRHVTQEAVACVNYSNCTISGNTMEDVGGGILFHYSKTSNNSIYASVDDGNIPYEAPLQTNANTVIENNTIVTRYHSLCDKNVAIELYGRNIKKKATAADQGVIPAADYFVEGVTVRKNKITAAGYGIILNDAKNNQIIGNTIVGANYDPKDPDKGTYNGIRISNGSTGNVINDNRISNIRQTGILIYDHSSATTVNGNTVKNCSAFGIRLNNHCKVTKSMKNNSVSKCPQGAIVASKKTGCYVKGGIKKNKISG